jgi:hypothetical protein
MEYLDVFGSAPSVAEVSNLFEIRIKEDKFKIAFVVLLIIGSSCISFRRHSRFSSLPQSPVQMPFRFSAVSHRWFWTPFVVDDSPVSILS